MDLQDDKHGNAILLVANDGWGDVSNVNLSFKSAGGEVTDLDTIIAEENQTLQIPLLKAGETKEIRLWSKADILQSDFEGMLKVKAACEFALGQSYGVRYPFESANIFVTKGEFYTAGAGDGGLAAYGLEIDTSKKSYKQQIKILEKIDGNSRLELPICFFPDKSCQCKVRIKLEVVGNNDKRHTVATDYAEVDFIISSSQHDRFIKRIYLHNGSEYTEGELLDTLEYSSGRWVSYPYVDMETLSYYFRTPWV